MCWGHSDLDERIRSTQVQGVRGDSHPANYVLHAMGALECHLLPFNRAMVVFCCRGPCSYCEHCLVGVSFNLWEIGQHYSADRGEK